MKMEYHFIIFENNIGRTITEEYQKNYNQGSQ